MENENKVNGGIPTPNEEPSVPPLENEGKKIEFSKEQQDKVNSLLKEERERIYKRLGVKNLDEVQERFSKASKADEYAEKLKRYEELETANAKLAGENAMLSLNIDVESQDLVVNYFKGKGEELTKENLQKLFEEKPLYKDMWVKKASVSSPEPLGNPKPENKSDNDKFDRLKRDAIRPKIFNI